MKRKTYENFMLVWDILQDIKNYPKSMAEKITRQIFENVKADKNYGNHTADYFLEKIIPYEEWLAIKLEETQKPLNK